MIAQKASIEKRILDVYVKQGFADTISSKVINHFALCVRRNSFSTYPRRPWLYDILDFLGLLKNHPLLKHRFAPHSYTEHLHRFTTPVLVIAGKGDNLAHYQDVQYGFDHVGSKDKTLVVFAKNGKDAKGRVFSSFNYGHLDLNLGKKAKEEVYPVIHQWLQHHT